MRAIETWYNGVQYRSRLEAMWGMFFQEISVDARFEYEGFQMKDGVRCLPDFFIPAWNTCIEIKHVNTEEFSSKYYQVALHKKLLIACGDPMDVLEHGFINPLDMRRERPPENILECVREGHIWLMTEYHCTVCDKDSGGEGECVVSPRLMKAAKAARNHRFW